MGILAILVFVVLVVLTIIITTQDHTIKKLNKTNAASMRDLTVYKTHEDKQLSTLAEYLLHNPIEAYELFKTYVATEQKRIEKNR